MTQQEASSIPDSETHKTASPAAPENKPRLKRVQTRQVKRTAQKFSKNIKVNSSLSRSRAAVLAGRLTPALPWEMASGSGIFNLASRISNPASLRSFDVISGICFWISCCVNASFNFSEPTKVPVSWQRAFHSV